MTTNANKLMGLACELKEAGLARVNISLHSLNSSKFKEITGSDRIEEVEGGIIEAIRCGLTPVKLNMVVMKGVNHQEIENLIEFSSETGAVLQLIEFQELENGTEYYDELHYDLIPVEEMLAYEEFTDRVELLRELEGWVKNIQRMAAPSTALIAPRRMGKTVLLDRLVNMIFFKPEYKVAPFYFKMKREKTTLHEFLLEYATTFFRQYIAYCHQDPILYKKTRVDLRNLLEHPSDHNAVLLAKEYIQDFLTRYERYDYGDARNHWDAFIHVPENLGSASGVRVAVIIWINTCPRFSMSSILLLSEGRDATRGKDFAWTGPIAWTRKTQS